MRSARVQISPVRVGIARALLLVPFAVLGLRAADLSTDERGRSRGEDQTQRVLRLAPERGAVVDITGTELALSVDSPSIYAIPRSMVDVDEAARKLAPLLGRSRRGLADKLHRHQSFLFLARWVTPELAKRVADLELAGVGLIEEPRRVYPHKQLAAQLVGFANIDGIGVRGIEQQEDDWLRGMARRIPVERDARGRLLWIGGEQSSNPAGGDIALTIDATLQTHAESALRKAVASSGARGGIVIVMDPSTGDVLTLAEEPSFDPNGFRKLDFATTRSKSFLDATDPGSTLKAFLVAAGLEVGSLSQIDEFDCEQGSFRVPGKTIRDHHPHGMLTAAEILRVSSNIGAVKIAYALGRESHYEMLRRFGFGVSTRSGFPDESSGLLRSARSWRPVDHATIAFGQGISVTPIQLAAATSALANGGLWLQPRLVAARRAPGGSWHTTRIEPARRVVREQTARTVVAMLESVVTSDGTGGRAGLAGVRVAGKTGTAQKYDPDLGRFANDRFVAWFIGIVPADDPKLAIVVAVDEPKRPAHTGGATAAPLFAQVAAAQLARFGIFTEPKRSAPKPTVLIASNTAPPAVSAAPQTPKARVVQAKKPPTRPAKRSVTPRVLEELARLDDRVLLPDFRGLTVTEVRQITAAGPLSIKISGEGRAVAQEPPPGTVVAASDGPVRIRFEARPGARSEGDS